MPRSALPAKLETDADVAAHLAVLLARDPRLAAIHDRTGPVAVRRTIGGFLGFVRVVCGQQLSLASAAAIFARYAALPGADTPEGYLRLGEDDLRAVGFSRGKVLSVRAVAEAALAGTLDFAAVAQLPADAAIAAMTAHRGIGPWTAEIYLMFAEGHADIFPAGDLALQKAVADALHLAEPPKARALAAMAELWAPHRSTAALLFWSYYRVMKGREILPL